MDMYQLLNGLSLSRQKIFFCHYHNSHKLDLQYCPMEQMQADVLTKPLKGPEFHTMHAFLMKCPVEYSKDPPFIPSPLPTLTLTVSQKKHWAPTIQQLSTPTSVPIKPWIPATMPSLWECVGTQFKGTSVPNNSCELVLKYSKPIEKKVTRQDALLLQHPLVDLSSLKPDPHQVRPMAE